jgi:hypothetical protein
LPVVSYWIYCWLRGEKNVNEQYSYKGSDQISSKGVVTWSPTLSRSTWCFTGPWNLFQGSMLGSNASIEPPEALFVPLFTQENKWDVPVNLQRYHLWIYTHTCEQGTSDCISLAY